MKRRNNEKYNFTLRKYLIDIYVYHRYHYISQLIIISIYVICALIDQEDYSTVKRDRTGYFDFVDKNSFSPHRVGKYT